MKITVNEQIILMALARFKFLTSAQLKCILGCKSLSTINSALRSLKACRYALVKSIDFGLAPGKWRMPPIHYLTKAGRKCLLDWTALKIEAIQLPSSSTVHFQHDYFHRVSTIWFAVLFQQWLAANGYGLVKMNVYFNRKYVDGQFKAATWTWSHGRYVEPDITALFRANGDYHTILFEQHNGKDAKRALKQIEQHCSGLVHTQSKNVRIIYVFQNPNCMRAATKAMMTCPKMRLVQHQFLFKSEDELQEQFSEGWHSPDWTVAPFLP